MRVVLCVFDDLHGWNTLPFLNNEFYLGYGDFNYYVNVPWNTIVVGSGKLMNPDEVLTKTERKRLARARNSDKTVMIVKPGEVGRTLSRPVHKGTLTWRFRMNNTRDVSFGASAAYVWDAARINLPHGKKALAMSAYPVDEIQSVLNDPNAPPILTRADLIAGKYRHPVTYFKVALGMVLLREQILGLDHRIPDGKRANNTWQSAATAAKH